MHTLEIKSGGKQENAQNFLYCLLYPIVQPEVFCETVTHPISARTPLEELTTRADPLESAGRGIPFLHPHPTRRVHAASCPRRLRRLDIRPSPLPQY